MKELGHLIGNCKQLYFIAKFSNVHCLSFALFHCYQPVWITYLQTVLLNSVLLQEFLLIHFLSLAIHSKWENLCGLRLSMC